MNALITRLFFAAALSVLGTPALRAQPAGSTNGQHIAFPDPRLTVSGLPWFEEDKPVLRRLPARLKETFRAPVWNLAQQPSGGRIRFQTDSATVAITAKNPSTNIMHHMTTIGQSGLDLYVDGKYLSSAWPDGVGKVAREWNVGKPGQLRDITIYLPLYKGIGVSELALDGGTKILAPRPFALPKPVVYYGSSITQGGCAENPGLSCQAIVSRWLNLDFVNLGFSGQGLGDPAVARAMTEIDASCFVLDFWGNPSPQVYRDTLPGFVEILRQKYPLTPILVTGPYYFSGEATSEDLAARQNEKRGIARGFVERQRKAGDKLISYVDGFEMLSPKQTEGLVDGVHANSIGFYFCAKGLEPHLKKALKLKGK